MYTINFSFVQKKKKKNLRLTPYTSLIQLVDNELILLLYLCISFIVALGFAFCVGAFAVHRYTITNIFMAMTNIDYIRKSEKWVKLNTKQQ